MQQGSPFEVFRTFLKLGLTSFGGPIAHLGYFHGEIVERRRWVSESQFGQLLAICQFLPGPASSQLGFSLGLVRAGWLGGLGAFLGFTLPSALLLVIFAAALPLLAGPMGQTVIHGLKLVALTVVADGLLRMAGRLCPDATRKSIALVAAAILLSVESAAAQLIVVAAGAIAGIVLCRQTAEGEETIIPVRHGVGSAWVLLALFFALLIGLPLLGAGGFGLTAVADAFYRAGALVFGGGHVVLPLLEESVVAPGWITQEEFLAGYGAAQAIPGPMFSFSAYLGAVIPEGEIWITGAIVALLAIFLPGFLLVSALLPFWRAVSSNRRAANAIAGVNAAVVGLLAAALYDPIFIAAVDSGVDLAIALIGFALLAVWRRSALMVLLWSVVAVLIAWWMGA